MRIQYALVVLLIVVLATASPITGQDEPLPGVTPRGTVIGEIPLIALASEPIRPAIEQVSIFDAARANDYATFDALYREARQRGESVAQYATLHDLWTWAQNDPIGAFYGRDMYERLARAYPGYAQFIADHRIVDDHGNAFWPTSETRRFLLDQVKQGRAVKVLVAEGAPATEGSAGVPAGWSGAVPRRRSVANTTKGAETKAAIAKTTPPPARATARDAVGPAGEDAGAPKVRASEPRASNVGASNVGASKVGAPKVGASNAGAEASAPTVATPAPVASTPAPAVATPAPAVATPAPVAAAPATTPATNAAPGPASGSNARGLLLLVIGIIGIGMLAIMLRAPREAAPASIITPVQPPVTPAEEKPKPVAVEPLRPADQQGNDSKPRATGSRG